MITDRLHTEEKTNRTQVCRVFLAVLVFGFLALSSFAHATVGEICGDGVDNDAAGGDASCAEPDKDRDVYGSSTSYTGPNGTAKDCDDTNRAIYPAEGGKYVNVGAGTYKVCQTDGTYSGTLNLSSFSCHSGSGQTYWFSTSGSNSNSGTFASPWLDYRCISENSGLGCLHNPVAGDCFVFRAGTYNASYSDLGTTRMLYLNNRDGTAANPITFMAAPGESVDFTGVGTSPTEVQLVYFVDSNYINWYRIDVHGGYSNAGIYNFGGTNFYGSNFKAYSIDGNSSNNVGGIKSAGAGASIALDHITVRDNYDTANPTLENNYGVVIMDNTSAVITDSVGYNSLTGKGSHIFAIKHGASGGVGTFKRNVCFRGERSCFIWEQPNTTVTNNYAEEVDGRRSNMAFEYRNLGNAAFYDSAVVQYNTINKAPFFEAVNSNDTVGTGSVLNAQYNVVLDNKATSYGADGSDGFVRIGYYGPDSQYTSIYSGGKLTINNNLYYQSAAQALFFTLFGAPSGGGGYGPAGNAGTNYASFAAWQGVFDAASFNENPTFDADHVATSANSAGLGWKQGIWTAVSATGATSSSNVYNILRRRRR